jgi:hypothetical protein
MSVGAKIKAWLATETKSTVIIFAYLALLLGAFTTYRRVTLAEYHISYFRYGYSLVEALVLTKVIVVGRFLHLGERFHDKPLIVPALYKTLWFSLLVLAFSILERVVSEEFFNKPPSDSERATSGPIELLAEAIVVVTAFVPLFSLWEVGRVLGEGKLMKLFFSRKGSMPELPGGPAPDTLA